MLELYEKTVEPNIVGPVIVTDYPREVSPLARTHRDDDSLVERFEVVAGRMRFRVGFRHVIAEAGDVVEVAPGVMHGFANAGDEDARVLVEVRPALAMEEMFADVIALAEAGRMNARGMPRNPLDLALLARTYDREAHAPLLGRRLQRMLLAPFVALARRRGRRRAASPAAIPATA